MTRGVCLCGTIRYELDEPLQAMINCHCSMCRKFHGAPYATYVAAPAAALRWLEGEEAIGTYRSSERGSRSYCRHCGAVLPMVLPGTDLAIAPAGSLEDDPGIRPQAHIHVASKAPWYAINDSLPRHDGHPPELGGGMGVERPHVEPRPGVVEGSCLCGGVAYEFHEPLRMYNCHCRRCRRARSAAHTTNIFVNLDDFTFTRGRELVGDYKLPEARFFSVSFCRQCGGKVPRVSVERGFAVVPAGTLDTDPGMKPQAHIFVGSKAPWVEIADDLPQFAEGPPPA
ncbi:MAG: GFA family protein [Gammaproteobacteria bacterium]|nr:GFA family protein [Gammaproteobacteria bacterium]